MTTAGMTTPRHALGVDPGLRTGLAVVELRSQRLVYQTTDSWPDAIDAMTTLIRAYRPDRVVIERPAGGWYGKGNMYRARCVGAVQQKADDMVAFARREIERFGIGCKVVVRRPVRSGTKRSMSVATWRAAIKCAGRTPNEHVRDAAYAALMG